MSNIYVERNVIDINMFRQCLLIKNDKTETIRWIPERFAILNNYITIKGSNGVWFVKNIYGKLNESNIIDPHIAIKNHRKNTGDSWIK